MTVHIKISDRNWILETMAQNLSSRLDYVTYDTVSSAHAEIQYYMTYSTFKERVSPTEIAYFTHLEDNAEVADRFFRTSKMVDVSVCMAKLYADMLAEQGVKNVHVIPPGVDLGRFDVKLRIGVVGRTYVTGRKGEALMAQMMDTPGVEFIFTGDGWPAPGLHLTAEEMPDFYRTLDYVLVPAQYEGGPMSAIEALASGVEVIAPAIGWMPELPHISYETNDPTDLRRVLSRLVEERRKHRTAILDRSWDNWAETHDKLFRKLLSSKPTALASGKLPAKPFAPHIVTHGMEKVARGGPSTRIPQLDAGLKLLGYNSARGTYGQMPLGQADLFHIFNVATPKTAEQAMEGLKTFGRPIVFSPIYLDNRCRNLWTYSVPDIFKENISFSSKLHRLKNLQFKAKSVRQSSIRENRALPVAYNQGVARLLEASDDVICLSNWEQETLTDATGLAFEGHVIFNPVQTEPFRKADPRIFQAAFGINDYVLCVGRIEMRKNQLILAAALSGTGIPLVLAGAAFDQEYMRLIREIPELQLIETGHLDSGSEMLKSAYAGCSVFCLPSWSEGAPISALEASAAGCRMVLSSYSSEQEYFGDRATYVDPANITQLRQALQTAYDTPYIKSQRAEMSDFTQEHFSVERHVQRTREVYDTLLKNTQPVVLPKPTRKINAKGTVYFDITTLLNNPGRVTGITRVELSLIRSVHVDDDIQFIAWHADRDFYFHVEPDLLDFDTGPTYRSRTNLRRIDSLPENAAILVQGNAWLRNDRYVMALQRLVRAESLRLTVVVHDIMPISNPQYFDTAQTDSLSTHLDLLASFATIFCVDSHATRVDLETYFSSRIKLVSPVEVIRLGDGLAKGFIETDYDEVPKPVDPHIDALIEESNYVLSVGSQMVHKNRGLLMHVWNRLVADLGNKAPTLVIVGKTSTDRPDSVLMLHARRKVVTLQSLSDDYLDRLYQNCLFTVFPSLCEGWGLPVSESFMHGKICISSDISSMPEIAPECTDLIDPLDMTAWYRRVRFYATSANSRQTREAEIRKKFRPTPWRATLEELMGIARDAPQRELAPVPWDMERRFDVNNPAHCADVSYRESNVGLGRSGASTSITFALTAFSDAPIFMNILCNNRMIGAVEVLVNGKVIDTLVLGREPEAAHVIKLPVRIGTQPMNVTFREIDEVGFGFLQFVLTQNAHGTASLPENIALASLQIAPDTTIMMNNENEIVDRLLPEGWHRPEKRACWSTSRARIHLPLAKLSGGALKIAFKYDQFSDGPMFVNVSGLFGTYMNKGDQNIEIPEWAVARIGSYLDLTFFVPDATSPTKIGIGADERVLGIYLEHLSYSQQAVSNPTPESLLWEAAIRASTLPFVHMLSDGWYPPEERFVWSKGLSQITLTAPDRTLYPVLCLGALKDHTVHIFADGEHLISSHVAAGAMANIILPDLAEGRSYDGVTLTLSSSMVTSPADLEFSQDKRLLGVSLASIEWVRRPGLSAADINTHNPKISAPLSGRAGSYLARSTKKLGKIIRRRAELKS